MYFYNNPDSHDDTRTIYDPTLTIDSRLHTRLQHPGAQQSEVLRNVAESDTESSDSASDSMDQLSTTIQHTEDPTLTVLSQPATLEVPLLNPTFRNSRHMKDPTRTICTQNLTNTDFINAIGTPKAPVASAKQSSSNHSHTVIVSAISLPTAPKKSKVVKQQHHHMSPERTIMVSASDLQPQTRVDLVSYIDNKKRSIFLCDKLGHGSYNNLYYFSPQQKDPRDDKLVIRVSNKQATPEIIKTEHRGVRVQYDLCGLSDAIGKVVDFGYVRTHPNEYAIMECYGSSLREFLEHSPQYQSLDVIIQFMYQLLQAIDCIHANGYIHLDLKPSNILFKQLPAQTDQELVSHIEFVIIDFGASQASDSDQSIFYKRQMASPAFSPPEVKRLLFGRKSDIWSYGVICYLFCIGKFFFQANGSKLFLHPKPEKIIRNIHKAIDSMDQFLVPDCLSKRDFLKGFKKSKLNHLKDFLKGIFVLDNTVRPSAATLLQHKLFSHI